MKITRLMVLAFLGMALVACSNGKAQQLLETAQFEEKQHNKEHATKLYQEIVAKYPDAAQAKIAQERLQALK